LICSSNRLTSSDATFSFINVYCAFRWDDNMNTRMSRMLREMWMERGYLFYVNRILAGSILLVDKELDKDLDKKRR
jgi:hypothetical protein